MEETVKGSSPFGPAAEQQQEAPLVPAQLVKRMNQWLQESLDVVEEYRREIARLERKLAAETERRQAAEHNFEQAKALLRQGKNLEDHIDAVLTGLVEDFRELPAPPETAELARRLEESEADRATMRALLEVSEAERRAALRARDALAARYQPHEHEEQADTGVHALRARLEAPTFAGVLDLAQRYCTYLAVTADPGEFRKLEHHSKAAHWRHRLADSLAIMQMYAEGKSIAKAEGGGGAGAGFANLRAYCAAQNAPLISEKKIAHSEGHIARSSPRGRSARTCRVPEEVSETGTALMVEHIRIGDGEPPAPRLHFLDDTDRSGLIVVGYFGDHLFNSQTN
ncbi:hypothetical protein ACFCZ6_14415 [Streptomyces hydrogenans]|uniref:hypothetical protein n=1 Tax=Streptomyces hydrogenans TaxID=1873719 RepID=UPI0035D9B04E